MTITYTWRISTLRTTEQPLTDTVVEVAWNLIGVQDTPRTMMTALGQRTLLPLRDTVEDFTAYADLSEAQVIEWVKAHLGEAAVTLLEQQIAEDIAARLEPQTVVMTYKPLPWVQS